MPVCLGFAQTSQFWVPKAAPVIYCCLTITPKIQMLKTPVKSDYLMWFPWVRNAGVALLDGSGSKVTHAETVQVLV